MWVAAPKENFFDGDEENAENGEGLSFSELLLLPKAEFAPPKIDGFGAEGLPNAGGDIDAASAPNPPPRLLLLPLPTPPNEEGIPKTGSASPGDSEAGSVQNPLVALLLPVPVPPKAEAPPLPKTDVDGFPPPIPRVEGLPKTAAEFVGTALFVVALPPLPRVDGLPNIGAALVEPDIDRAPNPPFDLLAEVLLLLLPRTEELPKADVSLVLVLPNTPVALLLVPNEKAVVLPKMLLPLAPSDPNALLLPPNTAGSRRLLFSFASQIPRDGRSFPEASISPQEDITTSSIGLEVFESVCTLPNSSSASIPSSISPKTTCLPLR